MGVLHYRYVLGERRKFVYHNPYRNPSRCKIVYYQGQRIQMERDKHNSLKEYPKDVSLVCFDNRKSAKQVVKCYSKCRRINSGCVLEAMSYIYDSNIKKHLVCFDRFDGFLTQARPNYLAYLETPNSSTECPGNPNCVVQNIMKCLINGLIQMHAMEVDFYQPMPSVEAGVSSSLLHLPIGYVCCRDGLKFFMFDSCREDYTDVEWNKILARDVQRFGAGLNEYFLKTTLSWPEKDSFMRCFSIRLLDENKRLPMIVDHPFLQYSISKILRMLISLHHSLRSTDHDRDLTKLMAALHRSKQLKAEFMPNGVWTRPKMSTRFRRFLRGEPKGKSIKYDTKDLGDLVRFLSNVFNTNNKRMTFEYIYSKIRKYWPHLLDRIHEKIAGHSTRSWVQNAYTY